MLFSCASFRSPFGVESFALFVPTTVRVPSRIGYNRMRSCSRKRVSPFLESCFFGQHCAVVDQTFCIWPTVQWTKANLPPASRGGECGAPGCKPLPLLWNGRCHSRCGCPGSLGCFVWFSLLVEGKNIFTIMCKGFGVSDLHVAGWQVDCMFRFGCIREPAGTLILSDFG